MACAKVTLPYPGPNLKKPGPAAGQTISHAKKVVQIEQLKYRIGQGISAEVLEAETALLNAESLSRQTTRQLSIALLAERFALGG